MISKIEKETNNMIFRNLCLYTHLLLNICIMLYSVFGKYQILNIKSLIPIRLFVIRTTVNNFRSHFLTHFFIPILKYNPFSKTDPLIKINKIIIIRGNQLHNSFRKLLLQLLLTFPLLLHHPLYLLLHCIKLFYILYSCFLYCRCYLLEKQA